MKKYIITAIAFISLLMFNGCYDLDRYPKDKPSSGNFFTEQKHADEAMMAVYSLMRDDNIYGMKFGLDCLGSVGAGYDAAAYSSIAWGTYNINDGQVSGKFKTLYEGITRANIVLQNVDNIDMSDELKSRYKGEAKFMRALYYFELLDFYGGVPIYDESLVVADDYSNMMNPRETPDKVREFILKDLDDAIAVLPAEWDQANNGRATSGAAMALKGKVYLYNKQYQEAAGCFQKVVESGKYALYASYEGLFKPEGDASTEMIFAIQSIGGVGKDYGMPTAFYMGNRATYGSCWNNVMPETKFVDSYEWKDGRPFNWDEFIPNFSTDNKIKDKTFRATLSSDKTTVTAYPEDKDKLLQMYAGRDPRMAVSIILPYTMYKGWVAQAPKDCEYVIADGANENYGFVRSNVNYEMYLWRKFVPEYDMNGMINDRAHTPINFPIIRYADVLLMLAECDNELGKMSDAVALVNQVRARAGMPGLNSGAAWLAVSSKEAMFLRIKHEREVELAGEGHSFSDMRRWGLLEETTRSVEGFTGRINYERKAQKRDYLWPIPSTEIDKNPKLEQNPGW